MASHQPSIVGLQQIGRHSHIPHAGIEPQVVAIWIKDDGHSVMDCCGQRIRGRRQDRAGLHRLAACVLPAVPDSREREQLAFIDFEAVRLLGIPDLFAE